MDALTIRPASVSEPGVAAIIARHFALMRSSSPEESCHVMEADSLEDAGATLLVADRGGEAVAIGALTVIAPGHGELKSMHTAEAARGQGVARQILRALIARARDDGLTRLSLETGSMPLFAPARALYETEGFAPCPPFGDYVDDPLSVFMTREV